MQNEPNTAASDQVLDALRRELAATSAAAPAPESLPRRRELPYKVPVLAGFLSGFFPGIGQLYVGYYRDGIFLGMLFAGIITLLASGDVTPLEPFLGISLGFIWLYGIIDAVRRAQAVNRHLDGHGHEPRPAEIGGLASGSVFGGSVLVLLGLVILLHTRLGVDMLWLADWWPLILVGVGGWLIWQARRDRTSA
jgi:hypothetical protein